MKITLYWIHHTSHDATVHVVCAMGRVVQDTRAGREEKSVRMVQEKAGEGEEWLFRLRERERDATRDGRVLLSASAQFK